MKISATFRPNSTCKITIDNYTCFLNKNDYIKLNIKFDSEFYLQVFPVDTREKLMPFIAKFEFKSSLISESDQISILELGKNNFEILITPKTSVMSINTFAKGKERNTNKVATFENGYLQVSTNKYKINKNLSKPKITFANKYVILSSKEKDFTHLYLIDETNNKLNYFNCNHFEIKDNKLKIVSELNDYAHHLKVTTIDLTTPINGNFDTFIAYINPPKIIKNKSIIPYTFIQNVYATDYKEARKYLQESFNSTITNESLKSFFGKFALISTPQVQTLPYTICLFYKTSFNKYSAKYFTFEFDENAKITNIFESN